MEAKWKIQTLPFHLIFVLCFSVKPFLGEVISTGNSSPLRTLSKILTLILILSICIPVKSWGVDGQRKLTQPVPPATFPIFINQAGSYVLTSNLVVTDPNLNAIEITVNDVTVDLNGHKIQGPSTGSGNGNGIYADGHCSITVINGRIWGFGGWGVSLYDYPPTNPSTFQGAGHIIKDVQAINNGAGGILVVGGLVKNCIANNNVVFGIVSDHSTISHCTANNSVYYGIGATSSTIIQCTTSYNGSYGIWPGASLVKNCTALGNGVCGIFGCDGSYIVENNLRNNGVGLGLNEDGHNFAIKNVASDNSSGNFLSNPGNYMPLTGDNANYGF